jgi:outer membrane receptor protein involved in Fe transport
MITLRTRFLGASVLAIAVAQAAATASRAQTAPAAQPPAKAQGIEEVIVTSEKRSEKLQKVPMSVQVLDTKKLEQQNVNEFQDYLKLLPSVTAQTDGPNQTTIYMRGIASGAEGNHSGPLPTVGTYLDELPITTIGGTLDVHIYDVARIEALPGPQGTLFGASSEAGTLRIITNQPDPSKFAAGYDLQGDGVAHGGAGGVAEGFVNIPLTDKIAIRLVAFDEHDPGYINNIPATRTFPTAAGLYGAAAATISDGPFVQNAFNHYDSFGGRAAIRIELPDDWTITPSAIFQDQRANGIFSYAPSEGTLNVERFGPDTLHDRWVQAGATITGKIGSFDLTYAGGFFVRDEVEQSDYSDYSIYYDAIYGSGANWLGKNGQPLATPRQEIEGRDHFNKESNEIRLASDQSNRLRVIFGAFQEVQNHRILQDYEIAGFDPALIVPGWANTIWLTDQLRTDRDEAAFGELYFDVLPNFTVTGGVRPYWYENSLKGFFGFSAAYDEQTGFGPGEGVNDVNCKAGQSFDSAPCVDLNKTVSGHGETHKINLTYKIDRDKLVYFTYSTGYRPGGVNRNANFGGYMADSLTNYELGFKSSWLDQTLQFNVALYDEDWNDFQYSFLGPNSLTIISNAPGANVKGAEVESVWRATDSLTFTAGATFTDAELSQNLCKTVGATCSAAASEAPAGTQLPYTPSFKGNLTARYTFDLFDWDAHVQATGVYQTRVQAELLDNDANGQNEKAIVGSMPAYGTVDFDAGITKNRLSLSLFVKNAFNELGEVNRSVECTIGICSRVYVLPIQPLTVGLKLAQRF